MTTVSLRTLTEEEYAGYRARSVPMYADELVRSKGISREEAEKNSATTFPATVADVLAEAGASISRVLADDEPVGWLWLAPAGVDSLFIYDIEIDEPHRGRGLAGRRCSPPRTWPGPRATGSCASTSSAGTPTRRRSTDRWAIGPTRSR